MAVFTQIAPTSILMPITEQSPAGLCPDSVSRLMGSTAFPRPETSSAWRQGVDQVAVQPSKHTNERYGHVGIAPLGMSAAINEVSP